MLSISMVGKSLSHYQVLEKIGAGGMGEVYRARDGKLGRDVAIKVLPEVGRARRIGSRGSNARRSFSRR